MGELADSIKEQGVLVPIIVRKDVKGYEIIAGHRRVYASEKANKTTVPSIIKELTDKEAIDIMVDTNIQRPILLPSELDFSYKIKYEEERRPGERTDLTSCQVGVKSVAGTEKKSVRTIQRYIALTRLIPKFLEMLDKNYDPIAKKDEKLPLTVGVELSYLKSIEQVTLLQFMTERKVVPNGNQAEYLHKVSKEGNVTNSVLELLFEKEKVTKKKVTIMQDKLQKYFSDDYSLKQMEEIILDLLEGWKKNTNRSDQGDIPGQESIETLEEGKYMPYCNVI